MVHRRTFLASPLYQQYVVSRWHLNSMQKKENAIKLMYLPDVSQIVNLTLLLSTTALVVNFSH